MAYEKQDGTGALFKNVSDNERAPGYKGDLTINGVTYKLSAWVKDGSKGKFFSIKAEDPNERNAPQSAASQNQRQPAPPVEDDDFGDSLPF